jgi:predicted dehydrogenase
VQGSYLQDWLLLSTEWNWRLEPQFSGELRAVADIGSHWLDLTTFITGLQIEAVCGLCHVPQDAPEADATRRDVHRQAANEPRICRAAYQYGRLCHGDAAL